MQQSEIYSKLTEVFHDVFDDPSIVIGPETTAADVSAWDSLNYINLMIAVMAEFNIKFQTSDLEQIHNVGAMVDAIEKKLAAQGQ